uniref:Putative titin n=1 Tax=Anopheles triannulatus TaxID=58253 RepID=A0A2M4A4M4_9DIPT
MATTQVVTSCEGDPNFGIILSFMEQFGPVLDVGEWNIAELKAMLENTESVPQALVDLHIKLMRKINKKVPPAKWELNLAKFAHSYSHQDAWEIERFGYKTANLAVKLRVLKALLEGQFDLNTKFKTQINTTVANELRLDPLGRDRLGNSYWYFMDNSANLQIYQMDAEMECWTLVASNREEFVKMIEMLKENRPIEPLPVPEFVEEEEDSGADSTSESEAMKRGMIPAPTEAPPSLIISRRTYKTVTDHTEKPLSSATAADVDGSKEQQKEDNTADVKMEDDADCKSEERPVADIALNDTKTVKQKEEEQATEAPTPGHAIKEESLELKPSKTEANAKEDEAMCVDKEPQKTNSVDTATPGREKSESDEVPMEVDEKPEVPLPKAEKDANPGVAVLPSDAAAKVDSEEQLQEVNEKSSSKESLPADTRKEESEEPSPDPKGESPDKVTVGEAIEDPPVMVQGEGSGADCDSATVQPLFSEVIEEPIMFFYGAGAGAENGMGNTKKVESTLATAHKDAGNNGEGTSLSGANGTEAATAESATTNAEAEVDGSKNSPLKKIAITKGNDTSEEGQKEGKVDEDANGGQRVASDDEDNDETEAKEANKGKAPREKGTGNKRTKKSATPAAAGVEESSTDANVSAALRGKQKTEVPSETGSVLVVEKKRGRKAATPRRAAAAVAAVVVSQEAESSEDASLKVETEAASAAIPLKSDEAVGTELKFNIKSDENGENTKHKDVPIEQEKSVKQETKEEDIKVKQEQSAATVEDASKQPESSGDGEAVAKNEEAPSDPTTNDQQQKQTTAVEKAADEGGTGITEGESPTKKKRRQRNGLVDGLDISMVLDAGADGGGTVRQSRRIAMQKIKEETNRRQIEDQMLKKMKADAVQKKKDLGMQISDDDEYRKSASSDSSSSTDGGLGGEGGGRRRKKKKRKKKKGSLLQQQQEQLLQQQLSKKHAKWNSATSSESSSETEAEDYFAEEHYHSEEDVRRTNALKSDHEFSPESDLESEAPAQPLKRARTARKAKRVTREEAEEEEEEDEDEGNEDHACQECKKMDQPEWILLCDSCDKGYHCACLKPVLFTIPEGDWFCPVCQHRQLIVRLQSKLDLFDALQAKLAAEERRRREEEQFAREAELAEQALANEREARLKAEKRARQQQRLLERADAAAERRSATGSGSDSESDGDDDDGDEDARERKEESRRKKRKRRQRQNRSAAKKRRSVSASGSDRSENDSRSGGSGSNTTDSDDIPIYKLRRRASAKVSYKFNEYDNLIDSAIRREMRNCEMIEDQQEEDEDDDHRRPVDEDEEEDGYGMSKGKDISTIIEATAREEAARKKALLGASNTDAMDKAASTGDGDNERLVNGGSDDGERQQMVAASRKALARVVDEEEEDSEGVTGVRPKAASTGGQNRGSAGQAQKKRKKKKKLCQIELSSEEEAGDDDSDEDFRGDVSGSEDDEDEEEDDDEDDEMNSMSGDSESSLEVRGRGNRVRKPSGRAAAKRRRIVENSDDSDEDEEEGEADRRRKSAKGGRKGRVLEDSDDELDLDDEEDDSEDYDSDDLCSDTETELSRSSSSGSSSSNSSSGASSSDGDWRKKKKKKKDKKSKSKGGKASSKAGATGGGGGGGGAGAGKHIERPKKATTGKGSGGGRGKKGLAAGSSDRSASDRSSESGSDVGGKGGKTMPRIAKKQGKKTGPAGGGAAAGDSDGSVGAGEKKSDRKTRGKKIHYIVDEDFESSDDGIRPGVQRPDTPPEEREQFIRRQEEIKRMLAENNAAKAKELATSKIDQLVGTGAGAAAAGSRAALKDGSKDSLSVVPMQVIESARVLDIDFLKSTSGNTARIATVDSVVDFDDELPEDFDPDDEMDDEALAKIMEEEDFAHHQLKPTAVAVPVTPGAPDVPPATGSAATTGAKSRRKSIDPDEFALLQQQQQQQQHRASAIARVPGAHGKEHPHPPHLPPAGSQLPVNLSPSGPPYSAIVQSPMKALLKTPSGPPPPPAITGGIPTSTIISPNVASTGGGASTILANALQTVPPIPPPHHHHHGPHHPATLPPPPLLKEPQMSGRPDVLMRHGPGPGPGPGLGPGNLPPHPSLSSLGVPPELHHKPELAHLISGLTGVPLRLPKGAGPPIHHAAGAGHHRMPPVTGPGLTMPPSMLGHAPHLKPSVGPPPPPATSSNSIAAHSQAPAASTVASSSSSSNAERRAGRRKKITPLREDLKRKGTGDAPIPAAHQEGPAAVPPASQLPPPPPHHHSQQPPFLSHPPHHPHHHLGGGHGVPRLPSHGATGPPVRPPPTITSSHNTTQQNASAIAAAAAAAAAVQELAIKVQQTRPDGTATGGSSNSGSSNSSSNMHINEPPISVPSSVSHLSYLSENPLFAHRLGPLPSSILASSSSSLQRIAAMSGAGPPFGDPAAYNGGWKPPPGKPKTTGATGGPGAPPPGMMVGPPVGPLEHYHDYNPATHYNPYYNVLDRAHHLRPPSISELHRTSTLSPTTFTTLQPVDAYQHGLKPGNDPPPHHHHHHPHHHHPHHAAATAAAVAAAAAAAAAASSATAAPTPATSSSVITAVDDSSNSGGGDRLTARPPSSSSIAAAPPPETVVAAVAAAAPTAASSSSVPSVSPPTVAESMATPPSAAPVAAPSSSASTSVFGELVSYFSSQQDDLDS